MTQKSISTSSAAGGVVTVTVCTHQYR